MISKQEIKEAWENWTSIKIEVHEFCDICNKGEYWQILLAKIPECFIQCLDCAEKFKDEKTYTGIDWGWYLWRIGKWFIEKD